jgi:hypothetical protein
MAMPPRPTEAKLREESAAVRHHCWMLNQTHELYIAHVANGPDDPPGMRQALAGAFAIHARCLHEFFYADEGAHRRDLLAEHYIAGWRGIRPAKRLNADEVRRIDTELAHLSVDRMTMPPEGVGFDVEGSNRYIRRRSSPGHDPSASCGACHRASRRGSCPCARGRRGRRRRRW